MGKISIYPEALSVDSDDYLLLDGSTNGTRKIKPGNVGATLDATLTDPNKAAPAKVVGDNIARLENAAIKLDPTLTDPSKAAPAKAVVDAAATKISKPTSSPNGTAGQLLRTNGDGTTQWVEQGLPTDEQTAEAIVAWLNQHPEATTTVQDGAITEAKLADDLYSAYAATGANLFEPSLNSTEVNGITYEFDPEEKTYHIYGTASANTYLYLGIFTLPAGQYKLLAMTEQGSGNTFRINLYNQTTSQVIAQDFGNGRVFTLTEETRCRLTPYVNAGVTLDTIIKPMITTRLRANIDNYAPYLYGKSRLDLNVSSLKFDLYKSKLTGDKTNNINTGWLYDVAKSWIDNASHIFYGYNNNLFWDATLATDSKYPLTCSVFACAMILGIKFINSKYNGLPSNISTEFGYKDDVLIDKMRERDFISHHLAKYFIEKGFAFIPAEGLKNVHTGDVLFYNLGQDDAPDFFMNIDHTAVFAYPVSDTMYYVWEVGDNSGPHLASKQYASNDVVLVARPTYNVFGESKRRITLSTQNFTSPVALTSLFAFLHGYSANMWKVYLLGTAYGSGASASSVYLIRTKDNGEISEKIAIFEGTGNTVRKLDENYNIIDAGGYYNQPVTVVVEWIG